MSFIQTDPKDIPPRLPDRGTLVYVGTLSKGVKLAKAFSVTSSGIALCMQPFIIGELNSLPLPIQMAVGGGIGFFIMATPILMHWLTKRYVTTMYFNRDEEEFTAATYSLFLREKLWKFTTKDVEIPTTPGLLTSIKVRGKPLFCDQTLFLDKDAYIRLMKYDEPLEWQLPPEEEEKKNES